jgi:hypothetical protein
MKEIIRRVPLTPIVAISARLQTSNNRFLSFNRHLEATSQESRVETF